MCIVCTPYRGSMCWYTPPPRGSSSALNLPDTRLTNGRSKLKPKGNQRARLMGSIRRFIWKCIWVCSFCTLGITVIYKDGVVIRLDSIWGEGEGEGEPRLDKLSKGEGEPHLDKLSQGEGEFKDSVKLGLSPSTKVEYWDCR